MERRLESGQAGMNIPDCSWPDQELSLAWVLALVSLAALAGDGTTGDLTGITTMSSLITTTLNRTAELSSTTMPSIADEATSTIAGLILGTAARTFMAAEFMVETEFRAGALAEATISAGPQVRSMDLARRTAPQAPIPERSVALVTVAKPEASLLRDARGLVEASTVEAGAFMVAVGTVAEATGNSVCFDGIKEMEMGVMTRNMKFRVFRPCLVWIRASIVFSLMLAGFARSGFAQQSAPKTFASAGEACNALFQAVQNDDEQALQAILRAGKDVTSSSDDIEDKLERDGFVQKYQEMHRLVLEPDKTTVLYVGAENWPFPIPLVAQNGRWHFDSGTGRNEVMFRRIGENEDMAIGAFRLLVLAEQEHLARSRDADPVPVYATRFIGVKGAYNGLDWKTDGALPEALVNAGISDES